MNGRTSILSSDFFIADVKKYSKSSCRTHRVPPSFDIGDDVYVIPYSKNTVIVKDDNYIIEFDTCSIANKTINKNGAVGKVVNFPYVPEDRVLIVKKEFDPFTSVITDNFSIETIRTRSRGSYINLKDKVGTELLVLPFVKDITSVVELDDGGVKIESYSDMIACKVVTKSGTVSFDRDWGELDVVIVRL